MKQTLITRLILGAFAGLAAVGAYAGQIQSSSTSIAREVIVSDTQAITGPNIAYRFFGDIDASGQDQILQVQFTLGSGAWAAVPGSSGPSNYSASIPLIDAISITDLNTGLVSQGVDYVVTNIGLSNSNKTLWATIKVLNTGTFLPTVGVKVIHQPLIAVNTGTNVLNIGAIPYAPAAVAPALRGTVNGLKTVVGDIVNDFTTLGICGANKTVGVSFKHYTAPSDPTNVATDLNANPDEHLRSGSTNALNGWLVFPTNVKVNFNLPAAINAKLGGGSLSFVSTTGLPVAAGDEYLSPTQVYLGNISLAQVATGYDWDLANVYALAGVAGGADAAGLDHMLVAGAGAHVGDVETNTVNVAVKADQGFVAGGTLFLASDNLCTLPLAGTASVATTGTEVGNVATLIVTNAQVNGAFGVTGTGPLNICYTVPGGAFVPGSAFTAVGTVVKAAANGTFDEEQNDVCNGTLVSFGNAIKIDVRNYASSHETSGYMSYIRIINPSDTQAADVWAQLINQDGTLGNFAKLTTLPVRGIQNFSATQIDAALAAGSTATAAPGTAAAVASAAGAPRLRITSTTGNTLRVQNYMYNAATGQILEASGSEAVDFAGTATRAPVGEGQYQAQDAQSALNLQ